MPHLVLEYSKNVEMDVEGALRALHNALGQCDTVDPDRVKSRATAYDLCLVGDYGAAGHMVHVTAYLLSGRPVELRHQIGATLLETLKPYVGDCAPLSLTVDIQEMEKDTYQAFSV